MIRIMLKENIESTGNRSIFRAIYRFFIDNSFRVQCKVRQIIQTNNLILKRLYIMRLERKYCIKMGKNAQIGKGLKINHHFGIIIGENAVIGDNCEIFQHVTIGQKNGRYPVIMNNVILYPSCTVIGDIKINNNAIVAPNSVVIDDVPENAIVSGIPARIIGRRKEQS